jgi:hypothetical protein
MRALTHPLETPMRDLAVLIDAHLLAYADSDSSRRAAVVQRVWAVDGQLIDPPLSATGHAAICQQADLLLKQFPGHRFVRSSGIDEHHGQARYAWQLCSADGGVRLEGVDFVQVDAQGQLSKITGFFGPLPDLESSATATPLAS